MVGLEGFEPPTHGFLDRCSEQKREGSRNARK